MSDNRAGTADSGGPAALRATGLSWSVGGLTIVDEVDLTVGRGELVSVIGPNGAGKTSLINLLSGVHTPDSGTIELNGHDVTGMRPADRVKGKLGRTFQTSSLFSGLTVRENVRLAAQAALGGSLDLLRGPRPSDRAFEVTARALKSVGLSDRASSPVGELSHGDKRKVEMAMVLASDSEVILLDEPTAGVSVEDTRPLVDLIERLHADGLTVVMVEHRMEFVIDVSDRVAVMHEGRMLTSGTPSEVMADPTVRNAYLGRER